MYWCKHFGRCFSGFWELALLVCPVGELLPAPCQSIKAGQATARSLGSCRCCPSVALLSRAARVSSAASSSSLPASFQLYSLSVDTSTSAISACQTSCISNSPALPPVPDYLLQPRLSSAKRRAADRPHFPQIKWDTSSNLCKLVSILSVQMDNHVMVQRGFLYSHLCKS